MVVIPEKIQAVYANMWSEAGPEQRKLSIQLARNSVYFTAAVMFIRFFGDQLAV
jgi:hypothetical protein